MAGRCRDIATRQARCGKINMASGGRIRAAARDLLGVVMATESRERQETSALLDTVALLSDLPAHGLVRGKSAPSWRRSIRRPCLWNSATMRDAPTRSHRAQGTICSFCARFLARRNWSFLGQGVPDPARPHPALAVASPNSASSRPLCPTIDPQRRQQHRARRRFPVGRVSPSLAIAPGR